MSPPDVRHITQGSLAHVEHVWARIPEAHVKVLFAVLAVTVVVVGLGVGRALPPTEGLFYTNALRLYGRTPI